MYKKKPFFLLFKGQSTNFLKKVYNFFSYFLKLLKKVQNLFLHFHPQKPSLDPDTYTDPDPHSFLKPLDPNPQKTDTDPKPWVKC